MQIQVEDVGPCKKLLKIEVPPELVDEELEKTYGQLNEGVAVPGFRPGHVPRWLLESKLGKQVDSDAKEALVTSSFEEAIKEQERAERAAADCRAAVPAGHRQRRCRRGPRTALRPVPPCRYRRRRSRAST